MARHPLAERSAEFRPPLFDDGTTTIHDVRGLSIDEIRSRQRTAHDLMVELNADSVFAQQIHFVAMSIGSEAARTFAATAINRDQTPQ